MDLLYHMVEFYKWIRLKRMIRTYSRQRNFSKGGNSWQIDTCINGVSLRFALLRQKNKWNKVESMFDINKLSFTIHVTLVQTESW